MIELIFAIIAYGSVIAAIVIFARGATSCGQDCDQGRECNCTDDEWNFK